MQKSSRRALSKRALLALTLFLIAVPLIAAQPLPTLDIEAGVPEYSREATITVTGRTKAFATVHAFVNDVRVRVVNTQANGEFRLLTMPLQEGENTLRLEAKEGTAVATKEYPITFDGTPPKVTLSEPVPDFVQANSLTVAGDVDEKVTIKYRVINRQDKQAPGIVTNFRAGKIEQNAVELVWDANTATDIKEYLITRNGRRIATTTLTNYRDDGLRSGITYAYGVSAVDQSCNIGPDAEANVLTRAGGSNASTPQPPEVNLSCEPPYSATTAGSPFSVTLSLAEGVNDVEIIFSDAAGNTEKIAKPVVMDLSPPKFIETNLDKMSPSYSPDVVINGKLDQQGTVFVYINNETKPSKFALTEPDGSFSIKAVLRTDIRLTKAPGAAAIEVGTGWVNRIKLEAVDLAGNKAVLGPVNVDYLLCGSGTWWDANIGEAMPSMLLPRFIVQGVEQIGIPFNITYIGGQRIPAAPKVDVRPILLAQSAQKEYDHDWVDVQEYIAKRTNNSALGIIQIMFRPVNPLPDKPDAGPNEKELALSNHRKGECLVPGVGCVRLFLQMEIQFQEVIGIKATDPRVPIASPKIENRVQRVCMPVEVAIDQTIPSDVIPKGLLRTAVKIVGEAIALIDKVLKPLTTIGEYVLYGCLGSMVWLYFDIFTEKLACEGSALTAGLTGSGWSKDVAEAGMCQSAYKDDLANNCQKCQSKLESRKKFEGNVMHALCDRIGCPSAPTFSTYIKDNVGGAYQFSDEVNKNVREKALAFFDKWAVGKGTQAGEKKLYAGNDCAFSIDKIGNYITPTYSGSERVSPVQSSFVAPGRVPVPVQVTLSPGSAGRTGIRELYDFTKGKVSKTKEFPTGPTSDDCKKPLHPAHPNCCGFSYQREWSSACGVGTVVGESLDFFDELKESTCLAAQQANIEPPDLNCNKLWNAVAGFCEKNTGQPKPMPVSTGANWIGPTPTRPDADGNTAYAIVIPAETPFAGIPALPSMPGAKPRYRVFRGYLEKKIEGVAGAPAAPTTTARPEIEFKIGGLTPRIDFELTQYFIQTPPSATPQAQRADQAKLMQDFSAAFCADKDGYRPQPCDKNGNVKTTYNRINDLVGTPDKTYIVEPTSGLLRSAQCVCLPAVVSYLQMWRSVLGAFHGCFSSILLTGEGSAGFCAAKLSGTICDLFFEFISCFTQKFSASGPGGRSETGGFGNVLSALTGSGTEVSRSVNQRYGGSPVFKSLFSERKLVHAICTWAFTGTWDLNAQALFQQQVDEMPVATEGALTTCQRTWKYFDPTTSPPGLTTWAYRIAGGLIAGADVRYRLKLKCSSGFNCDPSDYRDGKCDCPSGEKYLTVSDPALGNGLAKKFQLVNFDAPFVVNAQSVPDSDVRYDTAVLEWDWTDPQTKQQKVGSVDCSIRETEGGRAPAYCALDLFSGKFRCIFGEMEGGIKILGTTAVYPQGQAQFVLDDNLAFALDLKQKFPEQRGRTQAGQRKFLTYEIKDASGRTIIPAGETTPLKTEADRVTASYTLETNGVYRFPVPAVDDELLKRFKLNKDTLVAFAGTATGPQVAEEFWPVVTTHKYVKRLTLAKPDGTILKQPRRFLIKFPNYETDKETYEVWVINPDLKTRPAKDPTTGWAAHATTKLATCTQAEGSLLNSCIFTYTAAPAGIITGPEQYTANLEFERAEFPTAKNLQILVEYNPPADTAAQTNACTTKDVVRWTATFTFYDADRHGNPNPDQVSVDPETGKEQREQVEFFVRCVTKQELAAAGTTSTTPVTPQLQPFAAKQTALSALLISLRQSEMSAEIDTRNFLDKTDDALMANNKAEVTAWINKLAKDESDALNALTTMINSIQEPGIRASLQQLPLMQSFPKAVTDIQAAAASVQNALPGQADVVRTALNTVKNVLADLGPKKDSAQTAMISPAPTTKPAKETLDSKPTGQVLILTFPEGSTIHQNKWRKLENQNWKYIEIKMTPTSAFETYPPGPEYTSAELLSYNPDPAINWQFTEVLAAPGPAPATSGAPTASDLLAKPVGQQAKVTLANPWQMTASVSVPASSVVTVQKSSNSMSGGTPVDSVWFIPSITPAPAGITQSNYPYLNNNRLVNDFSTASWQFT
jgi:hypothetical protein